MADQFIGEIRIVGFSFAPTGWAHCDGALLPISQNTALFSLLGTSFGGDGTSTFALPNFQERAGLGPGTGPGLSERFLGEEGGEATTTLSVQELPKHRHTMGVSSQPGTSNSPKGMVYAKSVKNGVPVNLYGVPQDEVGSINETLREGGGLPHSNMQPSLSMNFIIALQGIFPSRP